MFYYLIEIIIFLNVRIKTSKKICSIIFNYQFFFSNNIINSTWKIAKNLINVFAKNTIFISKRFAKFQILIVYIRARRKIERSNFQLRTFEFTSKSIKKSSIQKIVNVRKYKRYNQNFIFNNKFYEYFREHYVRNSIKNLNFRIFASKFTYKIEKKSIIIFSFVSFISLISFIFFTILRNLIFSTKIISQFSLLKRSNFSITTYKINSKSIKNAIVNYLFILSFISSHTSI